MEKEKEKAEKIYKKYIILQDEIQSKEFNPIGKIIPIPLEKLTECNKTKDELKKSLNYLNDDQLISLYGHPDLEEAWRILQERRK